MIKKLLLTLLALVVLGAGLLMIPPVQDRVVTGALSRMLQNQFEGTDGLDIIFCGTASPLGNDPARAQACVAVITPDHFLLFDAGAGSATRLNGLPQDRLQGIFLTHFHSDHIAAIPDVNLGSWVTGRPSPLQIFGPEGVQQVVDGMNMAYAQDFQYRVAHHGADLLPPENGPMNAIVIQPEQPVILEDLTILPFTVVHDPIKPAVGYRIDYRGRSVVISGDTITTDRLLAAAKDVDVVIHDALGKEAHNLVLQGSEQAGRNRIYKIVNDVLDYHADSIKLEAAIKQTGARQLVLYHLVPVPANPLMERAFTRGLSSDTILAEDLMRISLPADTDQIDIQWP